MELPEVPNTVTTPLKAEGTDGGVVAVGGDDLRPVFQFDGPERIERIGIAYVGDDAAVGDDLDREA